MAIHCRIGSSETLSLTVFPGVVIHCRIGSSENRAISVCDHWPIHCRIGSSESSRQLVLPSWVYSLPDRQLRNGSPACPPPRKHSLPDRQLRKAQVWKIFHTWITKKPAMQPGRSLESVPRACQVLSGFGAPARMGDGFARKDPRLSIWRFVIENSEPKC